MKRIIITVGTALLVAVPAAIGLVGNTSFAQSVPVRVPAQATVADDNGGQGSTTTEPGDDKGGQRTTTTSAPRADNLRQRATASTTTTEPGDDKGGLAKLAKRDDDKVSVSGSGKSTSNDGKSSSGSTSDESNKDGGSGGR